VVVDFDDFHEDNHRLDLLHELKRVNPKFRCTLFAVPGRGSDEFWESVPRWCELAVHGWKHDMVDECIEWDYARAARMMLEKPLYFVDGFKAPGWQISDATYRLLNDFDWWVADQHLEDARRPESLLTYFYEDGEDRWHGHIQNVCGNGLEERWDELVERVASAESFRFCSEALDLGSHADDPGKTPATA
jgi:hypothetical protein